MEEEGFGPNKDFRRDGCSYLLEKVKEDPFGTGLREEDQTEENLEVAQKARLDICAIYVRMVEEKAQDVYCGNFDFSAKEDDNQCTLMDGGCSKSREVGVTMVKSWGVLSE